MEDEDNEIFQQLEELWEGASKATRAKFLREVVKNKSLAGDDEKDWR